MSPINNNHICLDLVFDFPKGCTHWDMDLEHIKTRAMTHRSSHSCEIGVDASCYYEATKTLLYILDLFYRTNRLAKPFNRIEMKINPDKTDGIPYVKLEAVSRFPDSEVGGFDRMAVITMIYSNADTIKNEDGIFVIRAGLMTPNRNFSKEVVLGGSGVLAAEYITPQSAAWDFIDPRSDDECWLSGPILKYSENFPAPSVMIDKINQMFDRIEDSYYEWERHAMNQRDTDTCVAGWTKLTTDEGEKEVRQLAGNIVRAWNGQVYSVVTVEEIANEKPIKIVTFSNKKQMFVTEDHLFIMSDGTYKTAAALKPGDNLSAWTTPSGNADIVSVVEIQEGPNLDKVYHALDPLLHKMMYDGIITVN